MNPQSPGAAAPLSDAVRIRIEGLLASKRVMLFMKGTPSMPQCGFSGSVVAMLKTLGAEFGHHNILSDPEVREGLKAYSSWPTYPQLYVDGKLVGGADIVREMNTRGELAPLVKPAS